jgi:hypothetical protein
MLEDGKAGQLADGSSETGLPIANVTFPKVRPHCSIDLSSPVMVHDRWLTPFDQLETRVAMLRVDHFHADFSSDCQPSTMLLLT